MANTRHRPILHKADVKSYSDFRLFSEFAEIVSSQSVQIKDIAWEIIRRYSKYLESQTPPTTKDYRTILGDARWGDAKRVEQIFGIKRSVLRRLTEEGLVITSPLDSNKSGDSVKAAKAKRLYCLISIETYIDSNSKRPTTDTPR